MSAPAAASGDAASSDDEVGDFADWGSEAGEPAVRSLLSAETLAGGLPAVLAELRDETGFVFDDFVSAQTLGAYEQLKLAN